MIIGIDPSLSSTGIVWDKGNDIIKTDKRNSRGKRLYHINIAIARLLQNIKTEIEPGDFVKGYIEQVPFGIHSRSVSVFSEVVGVIEATFYSIFGDDLVQVTAPAWKKIIIGKGNANKKEVREYVKLYYNEEFENQDLYDAWCIWTYGSIKDSDMEKYPKLCKHWKYLTVSINPRFH